MDNENWTPKPLKIPKPEVDSTTQEIYKSKKFILSRISGCEDKLRLAQRKYYKMIKEFVEGYEAGIIHHWQEYFATAEQMADYWRNLTPEQHKIKLETLDNEMRARNEIIH